MQRVRRRRYPIGNLGKGSDIFFLAGRPPRRLAVFTVKLVSPRIVSDQGVSVLPLLGFGGPGSDFDL